MATSNWNFKTFIYAIAMLSIAGFCGLCIAGFFNLDSKVARAKEINEVEHKEIVKGSINRNAAQQGEIEHIKEIVTDIRLEQRTMQVELKNSFARLEKKL